MPLRTLTSRFIRPANLVVLILLASSNLLGWSSMYTGQGFGTHQFLNDKAYDALELHPAYRYAHFPSRADIQKHGSISIDKTGLGPDVDGNSYFSEHWYNPDNGEGNAPKTIARMHGELKEALKPIPWDANAKRVEEERAHLASYAAHYIQDMTCPMHVSGMMASSVSSDRYGMNPNISPYRSYYSEAQWQELVARFERYRNADPKLAKYFDFFDPLYYDGAIDSYMTQTGSHFQYEFKVEAKYHKISLDLPGYHTAMWMQMEKNGYIPPIYHNDMKMDDLAKQSARITRDRIGTSQHPGPLWVDIDWLYTTMKIPYEDWWRAIQLTYVTWRSSFSALHTKLDDLQFVKIADDPAQYQLYMRIENLETAESKAAAKGVGVEYTIGRRAPQSKSVGSIAPQATSEWFAIGTPFDIDDPHTLRGDLYMKLSGRYDRKIPDSGLKELSYELSKIPVDAYPIPGVTDAKKDLVKVPELIGFKKGWAVQTLKGLKLEPKPKSAGPAPSQEKSEIVISQSTRKDLYVPKGTAISFEAYETYVAPQPPAPPVDPDGTAQPPVPPTPPIDQNATTPPPTYSGGLVIAGPTELVSGQGASYTATDGAGVPYTTGSFSWVSSVEDVLVLGRAGNPVSGVGFKEGSSTVIAHYEGMTAYLDVSVKADKQNVVPDITGILAKDAGAKITAAGLTPALSIGDAAPDKASEYTVYAQSPEVGKSVAPASPVTGTVYGKFVVPKTHVPGVVGFGANEARISITEADLVAATVAGDMAPEASKANTVQAQSHGAGSEVEKFTTVTLTLYGAYEKNERCQENQSRYYAAYSAEDYDLCQQILADSSDCAFASGEGSKLDQAECRSANSAYYSALSSKDYGRARSILLKHSDCSFYNDHLQALKCSENLSAMQSALSANDINAYRGLLAQSTDCSFYASLASNLQRAEQQAAQQRHNNQQLANTLGQILGGVLQVALQNQGNTQQGSRGGSGGGNPNRNAPPTVHQGTCNDVKKAGGNTPERHIIDLGRGGKSFLFEFDTYTVKDTVIVTQGSRVLFNSGCVGTKGMRSVRLKKGMFDSKVTVDVRPNCDNSSGTSWQFTVHCPTEK